MFAWTDFSLFSILWIDKEGGIHMSLIITELLQDCRMKDLHPLTKWHVQSLYIFQEGKKSPSEAYVTLSEGHDESPLIRIFRDRAVPVSERDCHIYVEEKLNWAP